MTNERAAKYQAAYLADYGFESVMVHYRRNLVLERLEQVRPKRVIEIGCGSELLYERWLELGGSAESWVIVEPAEQFSEIARQSGLPNLTVLRAFFEDAVTEITERMPDGPDLVICSGLLHEVPSEKALLAAIHEVMGASSLLHLNVPNSESLHRRLARAMGLITDTKTLSERNVSHAQPRVYDISTLKADLIEAGLSVIDEGGYLIKPFTHGQMEKIAPVIGSSVLDGLFQLGKELPDLASEIYVEARREK
jgi:SAM-dependent methyltransferase